MGTDAPTIVTVPVHCAPKKAPCPTCGKHGRRKRKLTRRVRTVADKAIANLGVPVRSDLYSPRSNFDSM